MIDDRFDQALRAVEEGALEVAASGLQSLLAEAPGHVEAWRLLAQVRDSLGQPDQASEAKSQARSREAENLAVAARGLWNAGLAKQAKASCLKALSLCPGEPTALLLASYLARQAGDFKTASGHLQRLQRAVSEKVDVLSAQQAAQLRYESAIFGEGLGSAGLPLCPPEESWATPFLRQEDWLEEKQHDRLLGFVATHQDQWQSATVWTKGKYQQSASHRVASVLYNPPEVEDWFLPLIKAALPRAFEHLGMVPFQPCRTELQVSTYRQGEYYRAHRDTAWPEGKEPKSDGRVLTFVYYFSRCPQRFRGGDLKLYDTNTQNGRLGLGHSLVRPQDNSLIFFPSVALHEVCPLELDSEDPLDGRFTVNGWLHR